MNTTAMAAFELIGYPKPNPSAPIEELRHDFEEAADAYLFALMAHGQVLKEAVRFWKDDQLHLIVDCPTSDALNAQYLTPRAVEALAALCTVSNQPITTRRLDDEQDGETKWVGAQWLYLFTNMFSRRPPITAMPGRHDIPTYRLSLGPGLSDEVSRWMRSYQRMDEVWLDSTVNLANRAYRQLADPRRDLAREGRRICAAIEQVTGIPTFYYLTRYHGRQRGEARRACPMCGSRAWATAQPADDFFTFRCEPCRLLSSNASSVGDDDDERLAAVGEYPKR